MWTPIFGTSRARLAVMLLLVVSLYLAYHVTTMDHVYVAVAETTEQGQDIADVNMQDMTTVDGTDEVISQQPARVEPDRQTAAAAKAENYTERYEVKYGDSILRGQPFTVDPDEYTYLAYINMAEYDPTKFVFATAASSNHYPESMDLISSIQQYFPNTTIYYHDIGLEKQQAEEIKCWRQVIYEAFNFTKYPIHVRTLRTFGFKPIIINEMIKTVPALFWLDASMRLKKPLDDQSWQSVYDTARKTDGFVQFRMPGWDIYRGTHPNVYRYLPGNMTEFQHSEMYAAGADIFYRTRAVVLKLIRWWKRCALVEDCIAPKGHTRVCGKKPEIPESVCHRHDQSSLAILSVNTYHTKGIQVPQVMYRPEDRVLKTGDRNHREFTLHTGC